MSCTRRRIVLIALAIGLLAGFVSWPSTGLIEAKGPQPGVKPIEGPGPQAAPAEEAVPQFSHAIMLPTDTRLSKRIEAANDYINTQSWDQACHVLQGVLMLKEDAFIAVVRQGINGQSTHWVSVKSEADRLLGTLPEKGLEFYQLNYGPEAAEMLKKALQTSDWAALAHVATFYLHTDAGAEATDLIATYQLDRGNYTNAALYFKRLLARQGSDKLSAGVLIKAALSFRLAAEKESEETVWRRLTAQGTNSIKLNDQQTVSLETLKAELGKYRFAIVTNNLNDMPYFRAAPNRNGQGVGGRAFLECDWRTSTIRETGTRTWLGDGERQQAQRSLPVLPTMFPVAVTVSNDKEPLPLVIFRSYFGVHAVDVRTGKLKWESDLPWSVDRMMRNSTKLTYITDWMKGYIEQGKQYALWENSLTGTLSTDSQRAYLVDDLMVLPVRNPNYDNGRGSAFYGSDAEVMSALLHNELNAYDLRTGKLLWHLGDRGDKKESPTNELNDSYFLGPPLPLAGKLYVLISKNEELRLVCLDPNKDPAKSNPVVWSQPLATTRDKMVQDMGRRMQAVHLAYGEGVLVCPTNAGAILGVDLLTHSLVWAHPYREETNKGPDHANPLVQPLGVRPRGGVIEIGGIPMNATDWKTSAPIIQDGKVVFTAPDGGRVHCISLKDGTPLWTANREEDDLYLAGVQGGLVVIVSKKSVRSIRLEDGKPGWKEIETGMPSGQGVASENIYYLPLRSGVESREPEIVAIDMARGVVLAHTKSRKREIPGNLLFYQGKVVSQTVDEIVAYPQFQLKLEEAERLIVGAPNGPHGRLLRGELRLFEGNLVGAIDDLRVALANQPQPEDRHRARAKLHEAFTDFLQRELAAGDFSKAEQYLNEYERVCKVDDLNLNSSLRSLEERRRFGNYYCLLGKGREMQGRLLEAYDAYTRFAALGAQGERLTSLDEPSVQSPPDVWAKGRINAMLAKASAAQRKPVENLIEEKWQVARRSNDLQSLSLFVAMTGIQSKVGREARLVLAERLLQQDSATDRLAENYLDQVRRYPGDAELSAQAVEALGRLNAKRGLMEDASYFYGLLGRDYGAVFVHPGLTGSDVYNELATDKRYLPYLDTPAHTWGHAKMKATSERHNFARPQQTYQFAVEGELLPFFQRHQLLINLQTHHLQMINRNNPEDKWVNEATANTKFSSLLIFWGQNPPGKFPYYLQGHMVILPLGHMVFGIDPVNRQIKWSKNLFGDTAPVTHQQISVDPSDSRLHIRYPDGWVERLGMTGPVEANYVCLQTRDSLVALHPVTGAELWRRTDVANSSQLFGDSQFVYLVEVQQDGRVLQSRAFRAEDGVSVGVPDFTAVYRSHIRLLGGQILAKEMDAQGVALRLYDVRTGKDVWRRRFPTGSIVLKTEDADLAGVVEPEGALTALDVLTGKEILKGHVKPKDVEKVQSITLLQDPDQFYLLINQQSDPSRNPWGGPYTNVISDTGIRSLAVNGQVYCFEKAGGKFRWAASVPQQMLLLEQYKEIPILLFTSKYYKGQDNPVRGTPVAGVKSLDKRTGKLLFDEPELLNGGGGGFHEMKVDPRAGRIELISSQLKIIHYLEGTTPPPALPNASSDTRTRRFWEHKGSVEVQTALPPVLIR